MAAIKPIEQATDKWVRRAGVAGPDYEAGIRNPRRAWAEATKAAERNYQAGVTQAAAQGRFGKGVVAAGDEKWKSGALKKGPGRFAEGVAIGKDEWAKGFSPYHAAIGAVVLPERGPKGDPKNLQRVAAIDTALRTLKTRI